MCNGSYFQFDNGFAAVKHQQFVGTTSTLALKGSTAEEQFAKH